MLDNRTDQRSIRLAAAGSNRPRQLGIIILFEGRIETVIERRPPVGPWLNAFRTGG
jgi:hypothetical protein